MRVQNAVKNEHTNCPEPATGRDRRRPPAMHNRDVAPVTSAGPRWKRNGLWMCALGTVLVSFCIAHNDNVLAATLPDSCNCSHFITLYNGADPAIVFTDVRVTAGANTVIADASISGGGWTQTSGFPSWVLWSPAGGVVPVAWPLPVTLNIWIEPNSLPKYVTVEWLNQGTVVCSQELATLCPGDDELYDTDGSWTTAPECGCVWAAIDDDPVSELAAEIDLDVEISDQFVQLSRTQVQFIDNSEFEPAGAAVTKQWMVTKRDDLGEDVAVIVPITLDLNGNATVDFTDPGQYTVFLIATGPDCGIEPEEDIDWQTIDIVDLSAAFTWVQRLCDPKTIEFTDASGGDIIQWEWRIYDLVANGGGLIQTFSNLTNQGVEYLFPIVPPSGDYYKVELEVIDSWGFTETYTENLVFDENCSAEFDWTYTYCEAEPTISVQFKNKSVGCIPDWNAPGSAEGSSGDAHPTFTYPAPAVPPMTYQVTLTMDGDPSCQKTHDIVIGPCGVTVKATTCPDCTIIYEVVGASPGMTFSWDFPNGSPSKSTAAKVKVGYTQTTTPVMYNYSLKTTSPNHCTCVTSGQVTMPPCHCCVARAKEREPYPFQYNGHSYLMKCKFKHVNKGTLLFPRYVFFGKTKLKKKVGPLWRAAKAEEIRVDWDGQYYKDEGECHCVIMFPEHPGYPSRYNKTKVKRKHRIHEEFRTRRDEIFTSTHFVRVDKNHSGVTKQLQLCTSPCKCKQ